MTDSFTVRSLTCRVRFDGHTVRIFRWWAPLPLFTWHRIPVADMAVATIIGFGQDAPCRYAIELWRFGEPGKRPRPIRTSRSFGPGYPRHEKVEILVAAINEAVSERAFRVLSANLEHGATVPDIWQWIERTVPEVRDVMNPPYRETQLRKDIDWRIAMLRGQRTTREDWSPDHCVSLYRWKPDGFGRLDPGDDLFRLLIDRLSKDAEPTHDARWSTFARTLIGQAQHYLGRRWVPKDRHRLRT